MLARHRFAALLSSITIAAAALCGCRGSEDTAAAQNADACSDICDCAASHGVGRDSCMASCTAGAVATTTPAELCATELEQVGAGACTGKCSALTNPAPGDSLGQCGEGVPAMAVGDSFTCNLGGELRVDYLALLVGCNDGETGTFTATFDDGSRIDLQGSCGAATYLSSPKITGTVSLTMDSGGGSDGNISFTDYGSAGLIVGYR